MKAIKRYEQFLAVLLGIFMVVCPFIMGFHVEKMSGMAELYFAKKSGYMTDIFQYCKEVALIVFSVLMVILTAAGAVISFVMEEKWPGRYRMDCLSGGLIGGFLILHIISCVLSVYPEYALMGLSLDYEGMAAIAGYCVLFAAGYFLLGNESGLKMVTVCVRVLALLLILGTCAECAFGPLFNLEPAARALTADRYEHLLENVYLDYNGNVSLTFANPGYYGGFCALLAPILFGCALTGKRRILALADAVLFGGLVFCIFMSGSTGALYGAAAALILETGLIVYRKRREVRYWALPAAAATGVLLFVILSGTELMEGESLAGRVGGSVVNSQYEEGDHVFKVERIWLEDGALTVATEENELNISVQGNGQDMTAEDFLFTDGEGQKIPFESGLGGARLTGDYASVGVEVLGRTLSLDLGYQDPLEFHCDGEKLYYIDFNGSYLESIPQPQTDSLKGIYHLFTGRGYIWASSLPLVGQCLLLGKGVGTFPFYYPQSEVAGMLNVHGSADYCIEIAHSWYLQTAVNGGVLALLCMLGLFFVHLLRGWKAYVTGNASGEAAKGVPDGTWLLFGLLAYQIVGIVNNSAVTVAPVFWLLFGCSMHLAAERSEGRRKERKGKERKRK